MKTHRILTGVLAVLATFFLTTSQARSASASIQLIDLGLSVKWADMNIDAAKTSDNGGFYAWGETATKATYTWKNYAYCSGTETTCQNIGSDISGIPDYDRACSYSPKMCLPTAGQWEELISQCTWKETTTNGVKGFNVTGPNGNTIFLPFSGCSYEGSAHDVGSSAYYWSANNLPDDNSKAKAAYLKSGTGAKVSTIRRRTGAAIRAVAAPVTIELVDLGLSVKWASMNIDAADATGNGGYYAWGETRTKGAYTWATYAWCSGTEASCQDIGSNISGILKYDRAKNYSAKMCLPTAEQWQELISKCTWKAATIDGVKGYNVTGPSGNSIFLPFSGCSYEGSAHDVGSSAYYWTANNESGDASKAKAAYVKSGSSTKVSTIRRRTGAAIRAVAASAPSGKQYALYNYRNDGDFNAWLNIDIDSITYSRIDTLGVEHDDIVVQEVWTPDSLYRIPLEAIDSIGFRAPAPVMRDGIFYLRDYHAAHALSIDSLTLYFDKSIKNDSLPSIGQVVLSSTKKSPLEEGFAGRVIKVEQQSNSIKVECEMIAVGDVYKRLVLVGKSVSDTDNQSFLKLKRADGDPWIDFEDSDIKIFEKIGDFEFSCLNGMLSVKSIDPTLVVSYYVYVDEFIYSLSADLSLIHHNLETHLNLSLEKILEMAEINKDVGDALKRLRDFKNVDQWLADLLKEQIQEENKEKESKDEIDIIKEIWKDLHFKKSIPIVGPLLLDIEVGPLLKFKGDLEYDMTLKNKGINTFHIKAKGYTMATLSNPTLAMETGLASVNGYATFESEPYTDVTVEANAKGSLSLGFTGKLGFSLIHKNVVHISMEVEAGLKASAALNLKYMDTEVDENDRTPYEAIKETKIKLEKFAKATAEFGVTPSDFFAIDQEWEFWSKDIGVWYLVPHFSKPTLPTYKDGHWSNGDTSNHLVLQSLPTKEIPDPFFGPCKVALRIVDDQGNIVKGTEAREYKDDNTLVWQLYPMEIDLTGLTPGKTYRCYPILNYFNWKPLVATPSYEFTVPNPLSLEAETIYLKKGESRNVQILGGWGDYLVFSLKPSVCSAELLNEGDDYYVHIVGKSNETTTVTVKDLRTNDTKVILVKVTDEDVGESTITVTPQIIDIGEVEVEEPVTRYVTISNKGDQPQRVKISLDDFDIWNGFSLRWADLGDNYICHTILPGDSYMTEIHFYASTAKDYSTKITITSENMEGWSFVVPLKAKSVEKPDDPSFHLSTNSIGVYVNDNNIVDIHNGSGKYEIINDYPDIVESDINGIHVAHVPPVHGVDGHEIPYDLWYITGKKVGHAVLKLKDEKTNEMLTLNVEVKQAPHLTLSAQSVELGVGETDYGIEIKAGSGWYDISIDNPEIASASKYYHEVSWVDEYGVAHGGTFLEIKGLKAGNAKVTVTDNSSGETAVIQVRVKDDDMFSFLTCPDDHHPHLIDLGLPSGTKWACCNVDDDASKQSPINYGCYYAWGETEEKSYYDWSTYTHCDGSSSTCHDLGSDIAGTQYDVAHVKWGGSWVMPSKEQQVELRINCTYEEKTVNGVKGGKFTSKTNGVSIFLPAAGHRIESGLNSTDSGGNYWSSTPCDDCNAYNLGFYFGNAGWYNDGRYWGFSVRPVSR